MVPACSFALSLPSSRARSAFLLHRLNRLAPIPAVSLLQARCAFTDQLLRLLSLSPLPSGSFCSLGIKAFNRRCSRPVRLLNSPDLCSLPANLSIASMALGSSFAVRYVSRDSPPSLPIYRRSGFGYLITPCCCRPRSGLRACARAPVRSVNPSCA